MNEEKNIFGGDLIKKYQIGDLVSWKPINSKIQYGIIIEIKVVQIGKEQNRYVAKALISSFTGKNIELILSHIKLESKVKK